MMGVSMDVTSTTRASTEYMVYMPGMVPLIDKVDCKQADDERIFAHGRHGEPHLMHFVIRIASQQHARE